MSSPIRFNRSLDSPTSSGLALVVAAAIGCASTAQHSTVITTCFNSVRTVDLLRWGDHNVLTQRSQRSRDRGGDGWSPAILLPAPDIEYSQAAYLDKERPHARLFCCPCHLLARRARRCPGTGAESHEQDGCHRPDARDPLHQRCGER